jgi:Fic family protein
MNQTPASNETKIGILSHTELNLYEIKALKLTWEYLLDHQSDELNAVLINKAHKFGFDYIYEWAGKYRTNTPVVGNIEPPAPYLIPELMINLFNDLNFKLINFNLNNLEDIVKLLAWFEYRFIFIHPYHNTNGRMGRLISNFILLRLGYPILDYSNRSENRKDYIHAMQEADLRNFEFLEIFIAKELNKALLRTP